MTKEIDNSYAPSHSAARYGKVLDSKLDVVEVINNRSNESVSLVFQHRTTDKTEPLGKYVIEKISDLFDQIDRIIENECAKSKFEKMR